MVHIYAHTSTRKCTRKKTNTHITMHIHTHYCRVLWLCNKGNSHYSIPFRQFWWAWWCPISCLLVVPQGSITCFQWSYHSLGRQCRWWFLIKWVVLWRDGRRLVQLTKVSSCTLGGSDREETCTYQRYMREALAMKKVVMSRLWTENLYVYLVIICIC